MRFVIPSTLLSSRLQSIGKVIVSKNTIPILDNFLFEINNGLLTLTASDSETTIRTSVELIECNNDCKFTLDARMIQDALKKFQNSLLNLLLMRPLMKLPFVIKMANTISLVNLQMIT